jgi:tetratricopeptide (TPR) repeat protein
MKLAETYLRQGRAPEAERLWRAVLAVQPRTVAALMGLGQIALDRGLDAEVEALTGRLAACLQSEDREEVAWLRAQLCLRRRRFARARELLERALALAPQSIRLLRLLGHALLQEGEDPAAAESVLRQLLSLRPQDPEARHNLALLLRGRG